MSGEYDIHVDAGATFQRTITWRSGCTLVDLTNATARMQIGVAGGAPTIDLSDGDGLTLGDGGTIDITITEDQTATLVDGMVYELEVVLGGAVYRLLRGRVNVTPEYFVS